MTLRTEVGYKETCRKKPVSPQVAASDAAEGHHSQPLRHAYRGHSLRHEALAKCRRRRDPPDLQGPVLRRMLLRDHDDTPKLQFIGTFHAETSTCNSNTYRSLRTRHSTDFLRQVSLYPTSVLSVNQKCRLNGHTIHSMTSTGIFYTWRTGSRLLHQSS